MDITLKELEEKTRKLLINMVSTFKDVNEKQINELINLASKLEEANWQLGLLNPRTATYRKLQACLNLDKDYMFKKVQELCKEENILEDSVLNVLAYYAGARYEYLNRK